MHISELQDPNAYLTGGELLLATGLALQNDGIGRPPRVLVNACREAGLTLLAVPAPTPFLTISRAFWAAISR